MILLQLGIPKDRLETMAFIEVEPDTARRLAEYAKGRGLSMDNCLRKFLERGEKDAFYQDTLRQPVPTEFGKISLSEAQLDELIERERQALWEELHRTVQSMDSRRSNRGDS